MQAMSIGIDPAKNALQGHAVDASGRKLFNKTIQREQMAAFFVHLPPTPIGMETCASVHHWVRKPHGMRHTVQLRAPQFVTSFLVWRPGVL